MSADSAANATISESLIVGNASGAGGRGANATGGQGGGVTEDGRPAGAGGGGVAGNGGHAGRGGGITLSGVIVNSTVAGNTTGNGGAGGNGTGGRGGSTPGGSSNGGFASAGNAGGALQGGGVQVFSSSSSPSLLHDTVAGNALGAAGAVGTAVGGAVGTNATSGSTGSTSSGAPAAAASVGGVFASGAVIANTVVSGNASGQCSGATDGGHNISFPDTGCPGANVDPTLGPLADNGGPTRTYALLAGSPAVGGVPGAGAGCTAQDQRGLARPQGLACDIGAYEQAPPLVTTSPATGVTTGGATLPGTVTPNLRATTYRFEYGTSTAYGGLTPALNLAPGAGAVPVSAAVSGLAAGTTYHYRLVATNADGTAASADATFSTADADAGSGGGTGSAAGAGTGTGTGTGAGDGSGSGSGLPLAKADLSRMRSSIVVDRKRRFTLRFSAGPALAGNALVRSRRAIRRSRRRGSRKGKVTLARTAFTVPATDSVILRTRLSREKFRILRLNGRIETVVTVSLSNAAGATSQASKRVVLRAPS